MGIPPPGPGMSIVFRQSPHDLDRLRVFREHHLAFGAVHVVTYVRLLPSGRSRAYVVHSSGRRRRTHILCKRGRRRFFLLRTRWGSWKEEVQLQDVMLSRVGLE